MKNVVKILRAAERALCAANTNRKPGAPDLYAAPLKQVRAEIRRLVALAPAHDLVCKWGTGEMNGVPVVLLAESAKRLQDL